MDLIGIALVILGVLGLISVISISTTASIVMLVIGGLICLYVWRGTRYGVLYRRNPRV